MASSWRDDAVRTIIYLPSGPVDALSSYCRREHVSRAEAIRRAVALMLEQCRPADDWKSAFGGWKDIDIDGVEYQRAIRAEWDDREGSL